MVDKSVCSSGSLGAEHSRTQLTLVNFILVVGIDVNSESVRTLERFRAVRALVVISGRVCLYMALQRSIITK